MKKLLLSLAIVGFAFAVQAGDSKACGDKESMGCCGGCKPAETTKVDSKADPMAKNAVAKSNTSKESKDSVRKLALLSPKAASSR
jgi:hypothetical protein